MMRLYGRPVARVRLDVEPQPAGWEVSGHAAQLRLSDYLDRLELLAAPLIAAVQGNLAVEVVVGLPPTVPLSGAGLDLDNYLYPVAQRLGPGRIAAVFGRKTRGESWLAIGPAVPDATPREPMFSDRLTGSYERTEWKQILHDRLRDAGMPPPGPGAVHMDIAITTGPGRNWANLWIPLLDAFGPVLGEDPAQPFEPRDDRITSLGLHHAVATDAGHDVVIDARWHNVELQA